MFFSSFIDACEPPPSPHPDAGYCVLGSYICRTQNCRTLLGYSEDGFAICMFRGVWFVRLCNMNGLRWRVGHCVLSSCVYHLVIIEY